MPTINPYIRFAGRSREALAFYQTIFGGQADIMSVKDSHMAGKMPAQMDDMVFHSSLYGGALHLMASDLTDEGGVQMGNGFALTLNCNGEQETRDYFDKLSAEGNIIFPLNKSEWGSWFGQLTDRFGVTWMIDGSTEAPKA